jgi:hypothetical protein
MAVIPRRADGEGPREWRLAFKRNCVPYYLGWGSLACARDDGRFQACAPLCAEEALQLYSHMANETAIVDAEGLKKRAGTLRRFL